MVIKIRVDIGGAHIERGRHSTERRSPCSLRTITRDILGTERLDKNLRSHARLAGAPLGMCR